MAESQKTGSQGVSENNDIGHSSEDHTEKIHLKRRISVFQAPAVIIGLIIGASIFITPGKVLEGTGSPGAAILIWSLAGVQAIIGALCYVELGTTYPSSGEKYEYLEKMYGPSVAFSYMWMYLFMYRPGAQAIKCITFGKYLLQLAFPECLPPESAVLLLGVLLNASVTYINIKSIKWSNRGHTFLAGVVTLSLAILVVIGLVAMGNGHTEGWREPFAGTSTNPGDIVLGMYSAIFAYNGWNALNFLLEELKNPYRNLPIAIFVSLGCVMVLYILVNAAFMSVLGTEGMLKSDAVAVTYGQKLFPSVVWLIPAAVSVVMVTCFNSGHMVASRLCFVTARRGHLPEWLGLITTWSFSPVTAQLIQFVLVTLETLFFDVSTLIKNLVFLQTMYDLMVVAGMIHQRLKRPQLKRPIKVPMAVPVTFLLFEILLVVIPLIYRPLQAVYGVAVALGTGLPVYFVFIHLRWRHKSIIRYQTKLAVLCQKIFLAVPQEGKRELN